MADTRAFLVGGPSDGRVLTLAGSPLTFLVPVTAPFTMDGPGYTDPTPIDVFEYHRGQTVESDGESVTLYTAERPKAPQFRDVRKYAITRIVTAYTYDDMKETTERVSQIGLVRDAFEQGYGLMDAPTVSWTALVWSGPDGEREAFPGERPTHWRLDVHARAVALDG